MLIVGYFKMFSKQISYLSQTHSYDTNDGMEGHVGSTIRVINRC